MLDGVALCAVAAFIGGLGSAIPASSDTEQVGDLEELIAEEADGLPDKALALSPTDQDAWILEQVLPGGMARTPSLAACLRRGPTSMFARAVSPLEALRQRHFVEGLWGSGPPAGETDGGSDFDIPLATHPLVDAYIAYFTGRGRAFFAKWLQRAERYQPIMQPILAAQGLPQDTFYLAMIESGFKAQAYSRAAAVGYWQFIRSTARLYDLRCSTWIDERRDFVRSTEAAAAHLSYLYRTFGDWHLAWAAYNAGSGKVGRALARFGERDFWGLIEHPKALAKETVHYVPKIIAAAIVAKNAARFGFAPTEATEPLLYDEIEVKYATDLRLLAPGLGVSFADLSSLNPALLYGITPPRKIYALRVPRGLGSRALALLAEMSQESRLSYARHRVGHGDTLFGIARRYGASIAAIKEFNAIDNPRLLRPGLFLVIPAAAGAPARGQQARGQSSAKAAVASTPPTTRHVVSAGETLWSIAQRYGVSVRRLKSWNDRRGNALAVGEILDIF